MERAVQGVSWLVRNAPLGRWRKAFFVERSQRLRRYLLTFDFRCRRIGVTWSAAAFPDLLTRHMLFEGLYQEDVLYALRALAREGDTVLDVGGHHGLMAIVSGLAVGRSGRVVSFEPSPDARGYLRRHVELNKLPNVTVEDLALSDRDGTASFFAQTGDVSWNSTLVKEFADFENSRNMVRFEQIEVRTTTLDGWVAASGCVPNLIKIDTEGSEFLVLKGALATIRQHRPTLIMEFNPESARFARTSIGEVVELLKGLSYKLYALAVDPCYTSLPPQPFDEMQHAGGPVLINVVATPKEIPRF